MGRKARLSESAQGNDRSASDRSRKGSSDGADVASGHSASRRTLFKVVAILAPIVVLLALEIVLKIAGYGFPTSFWIESGDHWVPNPHFTYRFLGRDLKQFPLAHVLTRTKPEETYRIFVFGASATNGWPAPEFGFVRILEAMLNDRFPTTRFELINTGITGINSHAVLPIVEDCAGFDGDLYIIYVGNNEVVGPFGPGSVAVGYNRSRALIHLSLTARESRVGQLLSDTIARATSSEDERPRSWSGMQMFVDHNVAADDPRMETVYEQFGANLADMCDAGRSAGVGVVLATIGTNIESIPPFASLHRTDLSADDREIWEQHFVQGRQLEQEGSFFEALELYQRAEQLDDRHAELRYHIGRCQLALGQHELARESLVAARDLDALRFRADTRINDVIRETARQASVPLVDIDAQINGSDRELSGEGDLFYEHVHPTLAGNHLIAAALFDQVRTMLPERVVAGAVEVAEAPSLQHSAQLISFTPYLQVSVGRTLRGLTERPPFDREWNERTTELWQGRGTGLTRRHRIQTIELLRRDIERLPNDLLRRERLARLLEADGAYPEAERNLRFILERYPYWTWVRARLGQSRMQQGDTDGARTQFEQVLELDPNDVMARMSLGQALVSQGRLDEALTELKRAVTLRPDEAILYSQIGSIYIRLERFEEAETNFASAVERSPDNGALRQQLGYVRYRQGNSAAAVTELERAVELLPDSAPSHYYLASARNRLGQIEAARQSWRRAIELDPTIAAQDPALERQLNADH